MAKEINLQPAVVNLKLYAGDGAKFRLLFRESSAEDAEPIPVTGTVAAEIRETRSADPPVVEFDVDLTDIAAGIIVISLTGDDTQALVDAGTGGVFKGVWDVEWTPEDEEPRTFAQGDVECVIDVTR